MLVLSIDVKDLKRFMEYMRSNSFNVVEDVHSVLEDSSELLIMYVFDEKNNLSAILLAHYIDSHYASIVDLPQEADDMMLLRSLLDANRSGDFWQAPVEPVLAVIFNENILRVINRYSDEYYPKSIKYVNTYLSMSKNTNLLKSLIDSFISMAKDISRSRKIDSYG